MALLNEWFMSHKADEATYGLVKMLGEIGRHDVEQIVREAVDATGNVIPDDMPIDIKRLTTCFSFLSMGISESCAQIKRSSRASWLCMLDGYRSDGWWR